MTTLIVAMVVASRLEATNVIDDDDFKDSKFPDATGALDSEIGVD